MLEELNFSILEIFLVKQQELRVKNLNAKYYGKPLSSAAFLFHENENLTSAKYFFQDTLIRDES